MKPTDKNPARANYKRAITWIVIAFIIKVSGTYLASGDEAAQMIWITNIVASLMGIIGVVLLLKAGLDKRKNK